MEGFSETKGAYYYCNCPDGKYFEKDMCVRIEYSDIELCQNLSNQHVSCDNNGASCSCVYLNTSRTSKIEYANLKTDKCSCSSISCGCVSISK